MSWSRLQSEYQKRGIALAVGSGISVSSELPDWEELLRRLTDSIADQNINFDSLRKIGLSLPVIAALLEEGCAKSGGFASRVRDQLYRDFPFYGDGVTKQNHGGFVNHVREHNPTLHAVATLCARNIDSRVFEPNPRLHAVINFNLDSLFQAYIYARYRKRLIRTIERPSASRRHGKINIYHIHGFLRFDEKWNDTKKGAADQLVLTEREYFDFYNAPTGLFSYSFLHLLREHSFLFVGLSMNDDNLRRLLHYSRHERFNALLAEGESPEKAASRSQRHFAVLLRNESEDLDSAVTSSLRALGVSALWVSTFADIPDKIKRVYESGGLNWSSVC